MKKIAITLLVLQTLSTHAIADIFQIISAEQQIKAVSAVVTHHDKHIGYTNNQGIIIINHPQGQNTFTVIYMGKKTDVTLNISGNNRIQTVTIP
ncbi:hypothetical protein [Desulforhopalus sp. IMCC35007]|uniref:hypothetical protein n=1 Tax=Desulforhopalus sp. IMCC35007 TaxID=2569543 RepID=UPI0010AEBA9C|nr:hypothetical protein [Desulforhopalus sp. IMCC35007]TKB06155.1 hypothetical protein FCL48_22085 [Desulforhopalus sp. IMCC35007]